MSFLVCHSEQSEESASECHTFFYARFFALLKMTVLIGVMCVSTSLYAQTFPALTGRVVDNANIITPQAKAELTRKSEELENKSTDQVVVATINSLEGYEIADYANKLYRHWKLGQKDKNNGVLILIAKNERKIRIEVGYGLEGTLTDAISKYIIQGAIVPKAKQGDFSGGLLRAMDDITTTLTGDKDEMARRATRPQKQEELNWDEILPIIIFVIMILIFIAQARANHNRRISPFNRHSRNNNSGWIVIPSNNTWGGGFGGGGGGFGGGGGSSGGGGASGDF